MTVTDTYDAAIATFERLRAEAKLRHHRRQPINVQAGPPSQLLATTIQSDNAVGDGCHQPHEQLMELLHVDLLAACFTMFTLPPNGLQTDEEGQHRLAGGHGVRDLIEQGPVHVTGVLGGRHDASPSLVAGNDSVGDGPRPEPPKPPDAGHPAGGAW